MKFSTIASASLVSLAAADNIQLEVIGEDNSSQGFVSSIHEGAGINYCLVAQNGQTLTLDGSSIYFDAANYKFNFGYTLDYLAIGPAVTPVEWSFNSGDVLATAKTLWACNNVNDPYSYSEKTKMIVTGDAGPNDTCVKVTLKKVDAASSSSAAASSTEASSTEAASATSEAASSTSEAASSTSTAPVKSVVTDNGAGKISAGFAGIAGVAAALIL